MTMQKLKRVAAVTTAMIAAWTPVQAHHSFAMYDSKVIMVKTGVVVSTTPDSWHFQLFIAELNDERKAVVRDGANEPIVWQIEMETAAIMAAEGLTPKTVPPGTIVSIGFYPLRNGDPGGARGTFALFSCPPKTPPAAGVHCDTVEGSTKYGGGELPAI
jgi:hypothetical protein